jgi:rfaE bifunctional protein nucleotidyltransferase chain/domain
MPADHKPGNPAAAKILTKEMLIATRAMLKAAGRRLVHCHGCFDIVHPGHIRHLRQARALGDCLLVSITGDSEMRKGTGRPLIPQELRAENLAALDCVDYVYVEQRPTAIELLEDLRPDVYVKGKEYENNSDPRFAAERGAVESHGGRVVFSSGDVVFSSTALIAAMEHSADPFHARLVQLTKRAELDGEKLFHLITNFRNKRVVIIGESILDTYVLCDRPDVAGESPILTLRPLEARHYDGGAAVVAKHIAAMGGRPVLVTPMPDSSDAAAMRARLATQGVEVRALPVPTAVPEKQRFLVGAQKVMKLDLLEPYVLDAAQQDRFIAMALEAVKEEGGAQAGIITDFGLGLFSGKSMSRLIKAIRPHVGILSGDVSGKRSNLRAMTNMDLVCPSEMELREALRSHAEGLGMVAWRLLDGGDTRHAIVTMGADGLIAFDKLADADEQQSEWRSRLSSEHIPALCPLAIDPLGCGDALLAAATLGLASGGSLLASAFLGSCAASTQVQRLGNNAISAIDLRHMIIRTHNAQLTFAGNEAIEARQPASKPQDSLLRAS